MAANQEIRRYDIDWLRVLAMLAIFSFHCARFFNAEDWHVKNNRLDFGFTVYVAVLSQWIMPLFFVLSAMSVFYSLQKRSRGEFVKERFLRLMVPLLFGVFVVLSPLQVYIERVTHQQFQGSFWAFYPEYFSGFYGFGGNFAWMGLHLWYLLMLFLFSLIALPYFQTADKNGAGGILIRLFRLFDAKGVVFIPMVLIFVCEWIVNHQPGGIGRRDFGGWSPIAYYLFFVIGYALMKDSRFSGIIEKSRYVTLFLALAGVGVGFIVLTSGFSDRGLIFTLIRAMISWSWILFILGFGSRYLKLSNRFLVYANPAVLPFYILHQTVIVGLGFYLSGLEMNVYLKYLMLAGCSFLMIMSLYELFIRRIGVLRFIFGMKVSA
ncbi:acyltransferase family protein [bacterium]|nr:acyltransferase family protein [bacterium]